MELTPTGFQISDCVESEDGKALDFKLQDDEEHTFEFILVSDNRTKPLASHLTLIIDNIQANSSAVVNRFLSHKAVYGYILTPGVKGFTRTRETLAASEQQTIYDIPLQEDKFQGLMNAAASIVGLKKIRNFQQAITVLNKLTGNFRYLYIRDDNNSINAKMAEELGKAGYIILSEEKEPKGEIEAFINAGGKIITGLAKNWQARQVLFHLSFKDINGDFNYLQLEATGRALFKFEKDEGNLWRIIIWQDPSIPN